MVIYQHTLNYLKTWTMKKNNYYSIHKNKKKRKNTSTPQIEALKIVNRVICHAIVLAQKMIEIQTLYRSIPKYTGPNVGNYKSGGVPVAMVFDNISENILRDSASRAGSNPERLIHSIITSNPKPHWINDEFEIDSLQKIPPIEYEQLIMGKWKPENDLNEKGERYFINDGKNLKEQIQPPYSFEEVTEINPEVLKRLKKRNSFEM